MWLPTCSEPVPSMEAMRAWEVVGQVTSISVMSIFTDDTKF